METEHRRHSEQGQAGSAAEEHPVTPLAPHDGRLIEEPTEEDLQEGVLEEHGVPKVIPRVEPRMTDELVGEAPAKQRYPTHLLHSLRDLWGGRELILSLVERDLRVRYKQAFLGVFWAVLNPILTMVLFSVVFGKIAHFVPGGIPYPIFFYSTLVPWSLFSGAVSYATNAVIANAPIIRKIYCPREAFPIGAILSSGADFVISLVILFIFLLAYGYLPTLKWLAFFPLLGVMLMLLIAVTLLFSMAIAWFRDMRYLTPSALQVLLFLSPIAYPLDKMVGKHGALHGWLGTAYTYVNPMVPLMDGFRRVFAYGQWPMWNQLSVAAIVSFVAMIFSYWLWKRVDGYLADVV